MKINCNWETCNSECKYFKSCNLHQPATSQLILICNQLDWLSVHLDEINKGINHFKNMLFQFKQGLLSDFIMKHTSRNTIETKLRELNDEKLRTISEIREYQIKEKNMRKILNRRRKSK